MGCEKGRVYHKLEITAPENDYDRVCGLLAATVPFGWGERNLPTGETVFSIHCEDRRWLDDLRADIAAVCRDATFVSGDFEQSDWLDSWKEFFQPVYCGRFVVLPPWLASGEYAGFIKIVIEPKSAFGTGHHATTALCLSVLSNLLDRNMLPSNAVFLDLGCGSGVLGIAAVKSGLRGYGLDIDELAVQNALENIALNNVEGLSILPGSIAAAPAEGFDLLMANILARPLLDMATDIAGHLKPGGALVLSGILDIQAQSVLDAYLAQGLQEQAVFADGEWRALLFSKD